MAQYDGSIRIGTKINTDGFKDGEKQIESESRRVAKSVSNSTKEAEKQVENLGQSFSETAVKIAELQAKMQALKFLGVETKEFTDAKKEVERLEKALKAAYTRKEKFLESDGNESSRTFKNIEYDIEKLERELKYAQTDVEKLIETGKYITPGTSTEQYAKMESQMAKLRAARDKEIQQENEKQAKIQTEAAEEERLAQIKANATVSDQKIIDLLERRKQLMAEIKDMEAVNVGWGYEQYEDANRELEEINGKIKDYRKSIGNIPEKFESMRKSAKKAFNSVAQGTKKSSGLLSTFASRLKGIALSLLIFNWISKGFNAMISGMKKGFENFMGYSDAYAQSVQGMKNAMSTLGNQFAAAFAPIVQMVIPWLNSLINALSAAMAYVAQFIAALAGKSTFTKAVQIQDKYNKSLNGTAKAADKARGALARFDDLDVLEKPKNDSGGGVEQTLPEDMFEEVEVNQEVAGWLDGIIERLNELKGIFMEGFWDGLGDWGNRWEDIKESAASIKDSLVDIWTDPEVLSAQDEYSNSFTYMLGSVAGAAASIGLTVATNLVGGIAKYLEQNKDRIKNSIVSILDIGSETNQLITDFSQAFSFIFEAFASEDAQQLTANIIGIFTDAVMGTFEVLGKLARDILNIFIQPFVDNKEEFRAALEEFLGVLSEVTGTIKDGLDETFEKLDEVYDEHLKPFFDSVAQGLSDLTGKFLDFWNGSVQPLIDKWSAGFEQLYGEHIQPMINNVIGLIGEAADFLKLIWEEVLEPLIGWIIENIAPVVANSVDTIIEKIFVAYEFISDYISATIDIFRGIIGFLTGVFTGDWDKVWNGAAKIFEGFKNRIKSIINAILGFIETMANGIISGINTAINALNSLQIDVPDWVTQLTGITDFGFNLSEISKVEIPRLATGAVIRGGNPFMAILGDQPHGQTNIETPLPTMVDAFKQAISEMGGVGGGNVPVNININYDNETFMRIAIPDLLTELARQGYDVSVLGVT